MIRYNLLSDGNSNAKTAKNNGRGYTSAILYLLPHTLSGVNLCPKATAGCSSTCLNTAGRGKFRNVQQARRNRTEIFLKNRPRFIELLRQDLSKLVEYSLKQGTRPTCRLNGTSDLSWEAFGTIISDFPMIQFYDYTKVFSRLARLKSMHEKGLLKNLHLTFSASEINQTEVDLALKLGYNVATVFSPDVPFEYLQRPVIDGDQHDLRFLDPKASLGLIIGLKAKGLAKHDRSGFVR